MYKKIIAIIAAVLLFAAGCNGAVSPSPSPSATASPTETPEPSSTWNTPTPTPVEYTPSPTPDKPYVTESTLPERPPTQPGQKQHPITVNDSRYANVSGATMDMFYVAPDGKDTNPGTHDKPFATLEAAQKAVRAISKNMTGNIYVNIEPGSYIRNKALNLTVADSGTNGFKVVYRGTKDLTSTITGVKKITGWVKSEISGVYKAKVDGLASFRQFYINGQLRQRSRSFTGGEFKRLINWYHPTMAIGLNGGDSPKSAVRSDIPSDVKYGVLVKTADVSKLNLKTLKGMEFVLYRDWVIERAHIRNVYRINDLESVLSLDYSEAQSMFGVNSPPKRTDQPYLLENALSFVDEPGEWFYNTDTNYVYYKPKSGEDMSKVAATAPAGPETFFNISGASKTDLAKNIAVNNLRIEYSTWLVPDQYGTPSDVQGNHFVSGLTDADNSGGYWFRPTGAVSISFADNVSFERNVLRNCGGEGVTITRTSDNILVNGNIIENIAASGVFVADTTSSDKVGKVDITNNFIENAAKDYMGGCGILVVNAKRITVEHNEVSYTPYTGISVGWGWSEPRYSFMTNSMVRYNNVHHVMQLLFDGGGIYTLGYQPDSLIEENYIHDITWSDYVPLYNVGNPAGAKGFVFAIYLDALTAGFTVRNNYIEKLDNMNNILWNKNPWKPDYTRGNIGDNLSAKTNVTKVRDNAGLTAAYKDMLKYK